MSSINKHFSTTSYIHNPFEHSKSLKDYLNKEKDSKRERIVEQKGKKANSRNNKHIFNSDRQVFKKKHNKSRFSKSDDDLNYSSEEDFHNNHFPCNIKEQGI